MEAWIAGHADLIELFYLPSCSPELNPDEYLNGDLKRSVAKRSVAKQSVAKRSVAKRAPARARDTLLRTATSRLRPLQRCPSQVKKFFQHRCIRYPA